MRIQVRRDTAANWTSEDPILTAGEFGYETDTGKFKIGDGSTAWSSLTYSEASMDHGTLTGLIDDDHLQYIKDSEFTQNSGVLVGTGAGTFAEETGNTLRTSLGLTIGSDVQAYDAELAAIAGLTSAADRYIRFTGSETADLRTYANVLADLSGSAGAAFSLNDQNLTSVGTIGCDTITLVANEDIIASGTGHITSGSEGFIVGTLTITDGSIDDTDGTIAFGDTAFSGVGTIGCGAITSTGLVSGDNFTVGTPVVGDLYGGLLYGTYASAKTVTAQTANVMPIQVHVDSQTNADAATKYVMAGYFKAKATTAAQANNQLQCIIGRMDADVNLIAAYGIQMHATRDAGTSNELAAGSFVMDLEDGGSTGGLAWGLRSDIGSTGSSGVRQAATIAGIFSVSRDLVDHNIYAENQAGAVAANMLYLHNAGTCATGIKLLGTYTNDIVLQYGETISNTVDGTIALGGAVTAGAMTAPTIYGSVASGGDLTLYSTSHATLGQIKLESDLDTDRWLDSDMNTFFGIGVVGAGNLAHTTGDQGWSNSFFGYQAGYANTTGYNGTFFGYQAGYANTAGYNGTFFGCQAGYANTAGYNGTFFGYKAGYANTAGYNGTFFGYKAGYANTTGSSNTFFGYEAGRFQSDGTTGLQTPENSVYIGILTKSGSVPADGEDAIDNEIAIGYNAIGNGSNTVTLGNTSIAELHCQVILTVDSDERIKKDVAPANAGLSFIEALNPITFKRVNPFDYPDAIKPPEYKDREITEKDKDGKDKTVLVKTDKRPADDENIYTGLVAQEVEAVLIEQGIDADIVSTSNMGKKSIKYGSLIMPLIKAVQELSARIEKLEK